MSKEEDRQGLINAIGKAVPITSITQRGTVKPLPEEYYTRFLSDIAKNRKPSPIRSLFPLEYTPGLISLLAGKPNPSTFPFTSLSFTARSPDDDKDISLKLEDKDLAQSLQYGDTAGLKQLIDWVHGLQEFSHGRKRDDSWGISIGTGSQDLIFKAVTALVNPRDPVLVESPVYAGIIPILHSLNCHQIGLVFQNFYSFRLLIPFDYLAEVETDAHGIRSSSLRSILENWPSDKPKPRLLYTVPYGCNPTGMTATLERRKEVLHLAQEHDFIILEDDPYFYLYYGEAKRYPSYFSLELEEEVVGRVLRFDSFSKVLSAGIRLGFASGPRRLLQAIDQHTATTNLQTSSLTQAIAFKLLEAWGYAGFKKHAETVSAFYRVKRDVFQRAMVTHLSGLAEWTPPEAGMFFWFKLLLSEDPNIEGDSASVIRVKAVERGVLALPGTVFLPDGRTTAYVRASFSLIGEEEVEEAVKRIKHVILDAQAASKS